MVVMLDQEDRAVLEMSELPESREVWAVRVEFLMLPV